jgi:cytochrome d ubiquinol oxidase subunit I
MELDVVELSRLQFAMTAMYHFLFVPLTLGLSIIVAIMETVYVMTGRPIWRQMTKFWATLFGINFVLGVATGITMEFQFGMNWSYYSHYVGDIFGAPLAIEGLMAFFLEATFVGLMFFGWDKLSKRATCGHLARRHRLELLGALDPDRQRLDAEPGRRGVQPDDHADGDDVVLRRALQRGGAGEVRPHRQRGLRHRLGLRPRRLGLVPAEGPPHELARRSIAVAASFGLASALSVVVLGDESGYSATHSQQMKLAAIEAMWETEEAPAPFTAFGFPDQEARETHYAVHIPWAMGLIGTRSLDTEIPGINELEQRPKSASARASSPMTRCRRSAPRARPPTPPSLRPSRRTPPISALPSFCCATSTIRGRRRTRRSRRPPRTRSRPSGRCSGPSA